MASGDKPMTASARRTLRADLLERLIECHPCGSIQGHMLSVDAMVRFVETGEIVGLSPATDDINPPTPRKRSGTSNRA